MFEGDIECKSYHVTEDADETSSKKTSIYAPTTPDNTPAILTFSNITVSSKGKKKKALLKNISGSITGGFWAIMGELVE